jgi:cyclophilin family peptidyl-prolyl cis-trans isomerase/HEAT repeat protein
MMQPAPTRELRRVGAPVRFFRLGAALLALGLGWAVGGCTPPLPDFDPIIRAEDMRQVDALALTQAATAKDARLRARAALAYGRIAQEPGIAPLLQLLGDGDPQVRGTAAFSLGQLGWFEVRKGHEAELGAALAPLLGDEEAGVRSRAIAAVGKLAEPAAATAMATPLLRDPDAVVRAEAATALHRCRQLARARDAMAMVPPLTDEALAGLRALMADGTAEARRAAIYFFARNLDKRALELAPPLLRDGDLWVRLYAVMALKRIADASAVPSLLTAAADPEYTVRVAAVQAMDALKQAEALPASLLADPVMHVRAAVATAYGGSSKVDEQQLVRLWQGDASAMVRASALAALATRRQAAAAALLTGAMGDASAEIRATAVSSAAVLGLTTPEATAILQRGLTDPTSRVRVAVLEQLGDIAAGWAYNALKAALGAADLAERGTAAGVLSARKEADRFEIAWQAYQASGDYRWRDMRLALLEVLAADPSAQSTDRLRSAARDSVLAVAKRARALLFARGVTDLPVPPVEQFAYSPYRELRFANNPVVALATSRGTFEVECFAADAPIHVASFLGLVQKGAYDGLPWHRVVSDFVIQGGDPEGSGWGDAGFSLRAEINEHRFARGTLGMPRGDDFDSGGSQLFFNHIPTPHLDGQYTVFGQIRSGLEVVDQIEQGDLITSARVVK